MAFKASILLLALFGLAPAARSAPSLSDLEINESLIKKNWPALILSLQPMQGQNFEQDLILAKAYLSVERRQDALSLLKAISETHADDKTLKLFHLAGTLFFSQDTASLFYEGEQLLHQSKFTEARERFDQALGKEPGHMLVLARLIQIENFLGMKDLARKHLAQAIPAPGQFPELKLIAVKLAMDLPESEDEDDWEMTLQTLQPALTASEVPLTYWAEGLLRMKRYVEFNALLLRTLKDHPSWTFALVWFYKNGGMALRPPAVLNPKLKIQIDKNLKNQTEYEATEEKELKRTHYLWAGYASYERMQGLLHQVSGAGTGSAN